MNISGDSITLLEFNEFAYGKISELSSAMRSGDRALPSILYEVETVIKRKAEDIMLSSEKRQGANIDRVRLELRETLIFCHYEIKRLKKGFPDC